MIVARLMGGLGNQMFQYALGRRLALIHGVELKLDCSQLGVASTPRRYELHHFAVTEQFASTAEVESLSQPVSWRALNPVSSVRHWLSFGSRRTHVREQTLAFDPEILRTAGPDALLEGYWQSPLYFQDIQSAIRRDFTFKAAPNQENAAVFDDIVISPHSVCLHVRRGDYVSDPKTHAYHGVCPMDYYERSIQMIASRINSPTFYVFSDEPDWVRTNLKIGFPHQLIVGNSDRPHEDLRLMAECKHFIIANSSFSWWAAWLGQHSEKTVIAPKKWAASERVNVSSRYPENWKLM